MKKVLVFVNPHSRQGAACAQQVVSWLQQKGHHVLNSGFDPDKQNMNDVIRAHRASTDAVIVGGGDGDGSVNHVLTSLIEAKLPLVLIPLGTANNLSRTLGISEKIEEALELLETGAVRLLDVGYVNDLPFMTVVGIGLSTQVNRLTKSRWKKWFGIFAFVFMAFKVACRMSPFKIEIICDGKKHRARTWQVTVCNGKTYGSNLPIHAEASLLDNRLHGLSTEVQSLWQGLGLIPHLLRGVFPTHLPVTDFKGKEIEILTKRPHHVDVDGDVKTSTPLKLRVRPQALRVFAPAQPTRLPTA